MPWVSELWTCYVQDYTILPGAQHLNKHGTRGRDIQVILRSESGVMCDTDGGGEGVMCVM